VEFDMKQGSSEFVRAMVSEKHVLPALQDGKSHFTVAVKDVMAELVAHGFPAGNTPQVCTAMRKKSFLREHGIEIEGIDGPPSKMSTTVVYRYRRTNQQPHLMRPMEQPATNAVGTETPEEWAHRLTGKLSGLLKEELAEYGGGEAFLRWVRSEDEGAA
jgi:hypothetical protein